MLKWSKINRRKDDRIVWDGQIVGYGKPTFAISIETEEKLPKPSFKNKFVPSRRKK